MKKFPLVQFLGGSAGNQSITVTASSTANVLGSWVSFGTLPFPCDRLQIVIDSTLQATVFSALLNIGIGPSGSQTVLISNIPNWNPAANNGFPQANINLDIPILPSGTELWANIQSTYASYAPRICLGVQLVGHGRRTNYQNLGAITSSSTGTSFTMGSGSYGSWVSLGSISTSFSELILLSQRDPSSLNTVNIGVGASGSQTILLENVPITLLGNFQTFKGVFPSGEYWIQGQGSESFNSVADILVA